MALFDWNASILSIPDTWRTTKGTGVKIAVLDTGADLTHPALKHLDVDGRKFDVTIPGFDPNAPNLKGKDPVKDDYRSDNPHGTKCCSIIAGRIDANSTEQLQGIAPDAEVYIIKVGGVGKRLDLKHMLLGLELAVRLDVDIISSSFIPLPSRSADQGRIDAVFKKIKDNKILSCATLKNTHDLTDFNTPERPPASRDESITVGTMYTATLNNEGSGIVYSDKIGGLLPEVGANYCVRANEDNGYKAGRMTCSVSTACLAGAFALLLAFERQQDATFKRYSKQDALTKIATIYKGFDYDTVKQCSDLQFFSPKKSVQP